MLPLLGNPYRLVSSDVSAQHLSRNGIRIRRTVGAPSLRLIGTSLKVGGAIAINSTILWAKVWVAFYRILVEIRMTLPIC